MVVPVLVGAAVLVLAVVLARRQVAGGQTRKLAQAGLEARAEHVSPDLATTGQLALLATMGGLGFEVSRPFQVVLPGLDPQHFVHARDGDGTTWFRSSTIGDLDPPTSGFVTYFPGGRLVTSDTVAEPVDPREVLQCSPASSTAALLASHRRALDAVTARGASPLPLPDPLRAIEDEWHSEARLIMGRVTSAGPLRPSTLPTTPRTTSEVAHRPDLDQVTKLLLGD